jgi:hypothetical protein
VKRTLTAALLLAVAVACLFGSLWWRSQGETRTADRLRIESDARATAAIHARVKALDALASLEAEARGCSGRVADVERATVEQERASCDALLEAARARGRLDVPASDLSAVVDALRRRR